MNIPQSTTKENITAVVTAYYGGADTLNEINSRGIKCLRIQLQDDADKNQFLIQYLKSGRDPSQYVLAQEKEQTTAQLADKLKELGVTHIIPADEAGVSLTDELCDILNLKFNGISSSKARRDKNLMHQQIASKGINIPFQSTASSSTEVNSWMKENNLTFPIVIKPLDGAGSAGVNKCDNQEEVTKAFDEIANIANQGKTVIKVGNEAIIQEFLQGTEYVVDTVSLNGFHKLTDIWQCKKGFHNNSAFIYEYFDLLDSQGQIQQRLFEYAKKVLDALEIKVGPGHAEIYIRKDGTPTIVEIGSRLGGPRMPFGTTPCVASNKAQTQYSVDAYLQPELFHDKWKDSYKKTKNSRMVFLICNKEQPFFGFNEEAIKELRALPSYYHEEFSVCTGGFLQKTTDVRSSPGFIYLIHQDKAQIEKDYIRLRKIEKGLYQTSKEEISERTFATLSLQEIAQRKILNNVNIIDGISPHIQKNKAILIHGNKIEKILPQITQKIDNLEIVDLGGKTIVPGLIDTHLHASLVGKEGLKLFLDAGVTTIRDVGAPLNKILQLRESTSPNVKYPQRIHGPKMLVCGPLIDGPIASFDSPILKELMICVKDQKDIPKIIDDLLEKGVDALKLYYGLPYDSIKEIVKYTNGKVPIIMHCGNVKAGEAAKAGVDGVEHVWLSLHHDLVGSKKFASYGGMTNPIYWEETLKDWENIDLDSDNVNQLIKHLSSTQTALATTLTLLWLAHSGLDNARKDPFRDLIPNEMIKGDINEWRLKDKDLMPSLYNPLNAKGALEKQLGFVKKLHEAGGVIVGGTDSGANAFPPPGYGLLREVELLSLAIGPMEAIKCVTSVASKHLKKQDEIGSIKQGCVADLVVLDENPITDITNLAKVHSVYLDGKKVR